MPSIDRSFSPDAHRQMAIESFSESLSIPVLPFVAHRRSTASICSYASELRFRESVTMEPAFTAAGASFADTLIVYPDSSRTTRTRFRTTAIYRPLLRPKRFAETSFVRPKQRAETRYVSRVEYDGSTSASGSGSGRRWHTTSVTVRPTGSASGGSSFRSAGRIVWRGDELGSSVFLADDDDDCGSFPGHGDLELNLFDDRHVGSDGYRSQMVVRGKFKEV